MIRRMKILLVSTGEFKVIEGSPLVGKTVEEIQKEHQVHVVHMHPGLSEELERINPPLHEKIEAEEYLKVMGSHKDVAELYHLASTRER